MGSRLISMVASWGKTMSIFRLSPDLAPVKRDETHRKFSQRGRHWVLVSLLLGNVITNETLPVVLDREVKGGWFAVLASTLLIVIFGEIIPQSICAKHGLSVGAWSSRFSLTPQKIPSKN
jgi:hypothetical protein